MKRALLFAFLLWPWPTAANDQIKAVGVPTYRFTTFHQCIEDRCSVRAMRCLDNRGRQERILDRCYKRVWGPCIKTCRALNRAEKWK